MPQTVNWGSVADWVSGVGSLVAAGVALYLSGADRRARRDAERPLVEVELHGTSTSEWLTLRVHLHNFSQKSWKLISARAIRPKGAKLVLQSNRYSHDDGGSVIPDEAKQATYLSTKIKCHSSVKPMGSRSNSWSPGVPGDQAYEAIDIQLNGRVGPIAVELGFESLEAQPDTFFRVVQRRIV